MGEDHAWPERGTEPIVGRVSELLRQRPAETINSLFKTEVIHRRGPWRSLEAVEYATLEWVDWYNHRHLLALIGNIPPPRPKRAIMPTSATKLRPPGQANQPLKNPERLTSRARRQARAL